MAKAMLAQAGKEEEDSDVPEDSSVHVYSWACTLQACVYIVAYAVHAVSASCN